jgi:ABC-2 type transport system permease protein
VRAALLIAGKDVRERLRDRSAILIAVVVPLALAAIFALALRDVSGGDVTFDYAVVNEDRGRAGRVFSERVLSRLERDGVATLRRASSVDEGRRLAETGSVAATFAVPRGFSVALAARRPARLSVIGDVDQPIGTLVARSVAESYARELTGVRLAVATVLAAARRARATPQELGNEAAALPPPIAVEDVSTTKKELDAATFYSAGIAVFFLFFTVQFGIVSLLDERREGTLGRLLAAPVRRVSILGGKLLTSLALGVVSMGVLAVASSLLLGADWGSPLGVALLVVAGVVAATAVAALVATMAKTPEQAGSWQAIIGVVLGMLGGSFFPVSQAGGFVERLSLLTPHAWFLRGLTDLAGGAGAAAVLPAVGVILAFAAVPATVALLRLGRLLAA